MDPFSGKIVTISSGEIPNIIAPELAVYAERLGGLGVKTACGNTLGLCAELRGANELLLNNPRLKLNDIKFTSAVRPRTGETVPRCKNCINIFWSRIMEMDEEFLESNDLDWFASSSISGMLAHFATGGKGYIPVEIRKSILTYEKIYDYFLSIEKNHEIEIIEENLPKFNTIKARDHYLKTFTQMAHKGLFSYDADRTRDGYFLIAKPKINLLKSELPTDIIDIIHTLPLIFHTHIKPNTTT